jgi:hypothetical protein
MRRESLRQNRHSEPCPPQAKRGCQAADPGAYDEHGAALAMLHLFRTSHEHTNKSGGNALARAGDAVPMHSRPPSTKRR